MSVKIDTYDALKAELLDEIEAADSEVAAHQIVCDRLYERLDAYSWAGVYVVEGDDLVLSAWAGPEETEHTRIAIGEGICGLAAATGETELVPDVSQRPEFIACFPSTRSEIVVPIHGPNGVIGEIDIDSDWRDAFGATDRALLEALATALAGKTATGA